MTLDEAVSSISGWPKVHIICIPVGDCWRVLVRSPPDDYKILCESQNHSALLALTTGLREHRAILRKLKGD